MTLKLDDTDLEILRLLEADARRSASEIGRLANLSAPAAKRRIVRMEEAGIIRGYTVDVDRRLLGDHLEAFIEMRFAPGTQVAEIDSAVADLPELIAAFTLAGDPDALAQVRVRDVEHLKAVVDRIRRGRRDGPRVISTRTVIVLAKTSPR